MYILGISAFYHDAAAALLRDGEIIAASEEERFTRKKHDHSFPKNAINFCLDFAGIEAKDLDYVVFYEKPFTKFERILSTAVAVWPLGIMPFLKAMPMWLNEKLWIPQIIEKELKYKGKILFTEHHLSHAASSFLLSPFDKAAILTIDGVGEWATAFKGYGDGMDIHITHEMKFPHSLGLLYSAFTAFLGFEVNEGEYKVMGLAPYGEPKYIDKIKKIIDIQEDGSIHLDMSYFAYHRSFKSFSKKFTALFGPPRNPEAKMETHYQDIAASIQEITEEIIFKMTKKLYEDTGLENLCLSGGVALNCTANGKLLREGPFKKIFIQPASGDAGGAIGAAAYVYNTVLKKEPRTKMHSIYLGPEFSDEEIEEYLKEAVSEHELTYEKVERDALLEKTAKHLSEDKVVGWFQGRMEMGPRALGSRSILANPSNPDMKDILNAKIKHRELFRPFAPSLLNDRKHDFFEISVESPYMLYTVFVKENKQKHLPAITHVNGTARIQTVTPEQNQLYYDLISEFEKIVGIPVIINTSFNVRGEPIVCTPHDAFNCFMKTDMDVLVLGNFIVVK